MRQTYTAHTLCRQKHNYGGALHVSGDLNSPIRSESAPTPAMAAAPNAADITAMAIGWAGLAPCAHSCAPQPRLLVSYTLADLPPGSGALTASMVRLRRAASSVGGGPATTN